MAFLSCFEELDKELCEPKIRSFMEKQVKFIDLFLTFQSFAPKVTKIATGETEKGEVVDSTLRLFYDKFMVGLEL